MHVTLNGESRETTATTVRQLVEELGLGKQAVAVELNRQVIPRRAHEQTPVNEGDTLEVVSLVGGG